MSRPILRPAAAADLEEAYRWYEGQREGLGEELLATVGTTLESLVANPRMYPVIHRDTRRALLRRFPYGIYYRLVGERILVVACFHTSRDPKRWRARR